KDITESGNDMKLRVAGLAPDSAALVDDHMNYSSGMQAIKLVPASKGNFSYFATSKDAPINKERFTKGYTFETFINIDKDYSDPNYWSAFLSRGGTRNDLPNFNVPGADDSDLDEPPMAGAISSLKEIQWVFTDIAPVGMGYSDWSGDVDLGKWYHIAVVDDPAEGSVVMYVNGVPMLRNQYGTKGQAHGINGFDDLPWIIGGSIYGGAMDKGFFGLIGEMRFIDHPTTPEHWLTARATKSSPTPSSSTTPTSTSTTTPSGTASSTPSATTPSTQSPAAPSSGPSVTAPSIFPGRRAPRPSRLPRTGR
ncbi:MAG: LamG-like jellyroll fold domain-containing protein, partial [Cutibacterium avidum]|nr:LamG-like jellyroll fold domain-containing protein [Cutibacterium avidum]